MHANRFTTALVLAFVCAALVADQAAAQPMPDSLLVVVAHQAEDAGLIRVSFGEGIDEPDSLQLMADSVQHGQYVDALVYFDRENPELFFLLYDYELQAELLYSVSSADVILAGHYLTLFIPERSAEWLDAVFDDGTTLRVEYVVAESVDEDRPDVIEGDIRVYPNPATEQTRIAFDVRYPVDVALEVLDVLGRVVTRDGYHATMGANEYDVALDGLGPGVYFIRLTATDGGRRAARTAAIVVGT